MRPESLPVSLQVRFVASCRPPPADHARIAPPTKKNAGAVPRRSFSSSELSFYCELRSSLIVVEAALARFVSALAPRRAAFAATLRPGHVAASASAGIEAARGRRRTAGEIGTPIAHRTAVATAR